MGRSHEVCTLRVPSLPLVVSILNHQGHEGHEGRQKQMKLSPQWLREFVDLKVDNRRLAEDLTNAGVAVEGIAGDGDQTVFDAEITPNRPDAMNHYGVAREASAIYTAP